MPLYLMLIAALVPAMQFETRPPSTSETQAQAAMSEAWNARRRVLHALCGDDSRERRLRSADARFQAATETYNARYGHSWNAPGDTSMRQWECSLPDGFEWTLSSYHNALSEIDGVFSR